MKHKILAFVVALKTCSCSLHFEEALLFIGAMYKKYNIIELTRVLVLHCLGILYLLMFSHLSSSYPRLMPNCQWGRTQKSKGFGG